MQFIKNNKIILVIIIIGLAFFGYKSFLASPKVDNNIGLGVESVGLDTEFSQYLSKLKQIQIDDKLFTSTIWKNLEDFSIVVPEIAPGNENLFKTTNSSSVSSPSSQSVKATNPVANPIKNPTANPVANIKR